MAEDVDFGGEARERMACVYSLTMDFRAFIPLIAAIVLALITFWVVRRSNFTIQRSAANRLNSFAEQDRRGVTDRLGDLLVDRLGLSLASWKQELRWAQIGGHYLTGAGQPRTVGSVLGQSVLFGSLGLAYILLFHAFSPIYLILIALAVYYPYLTLRGRADTVRDVVKRGLPEATALVAAEMSAGNSITLAVERASSLPGPVIDYHTRSSDQNGPDRPLVPGIVGRDCPPSSGGIPPLSIPHKQPLASPGLKS